MLFEPTGQVQELRIGPEDAGLRLDRYLTRMREDYSRSILQKMIQQGWVLVNQRQVKPSYRLRTGDHIKITWARVKPMDEIKPIARPLKILDATEHYLVVFKPAGLVVHPGAGYHEDTLVHRLIASYPEIQTVGHPLRPGIVHRLDRVTSGIMVVARNSRAYLALIKAFKERKVRKIYDAICIGVPQPPAGEIKTLIGRHPKHRKRFDVVVRNGKPAHTRYRVKGIGRSLSYVRVSIYTGRTHQIRVHMSYRGTPLFADPVYGRTGMKYFDPALQQMIKKLRMIPAIPLVARYLAFPDPSSGEMRVYRGPVPKWFKKIIRLDEIKPTNR